VGNHTHHLSFRFIIKRKALLEPFLREQLEYGIEVLSTEDENLWRPDILLLLRYLPLISVLVFHIVIQRIELKEHVAAPADEVLTELLRLILVDSWMRSYLHADASNSA